MGIDMKKFLHVGCGSKNKNFLKGFDQNWHEVRYDIDENVKPDIIGTITKMTFVESDSYDAIYSAHNLEHIFPHEVPYALEEFCRVLKPDGFALITCPDLQSLGNILRRGDIWKTLYHSPAGPINALDILYGHRVSIQSGNEFMAHKGGFTISFLQDNLLAAGFKKVYGIRRLNLFELWAIGFKDYADDNLIKTIVDTHIP